MSIFTNKKNIYTFKAFNNGRLVGQMKYGNNSLVYAKYLLHQGIDFKYINVYNRKPWTFLGRTYRNEF